MNKNRIIAIVLSSLLFVGGTFTPTYAAESTSTSTSKTEVVQNAVSTSNENLQTSIAKENSVKKTSTQNLVSGIGSSWSKIEGGLKQISVGEYGVWGVNSSGQICFRNGVTKINPAGSEWTLISGALDQISVGPYGVWGTDSSNQIWFRNRIVE